MRLIHTVIDFLDKQRICKKEDLPEKNFMRLI